MKKKLSQSCFTYAERKELSTRTQLLPPEKLSVALGIIFGDEKVTQKGTEFTVDFALLDDSICFQLATLIKSHDVSARVGPSNPPAASTNKRKQSLARNKRGWGRGGMNVGAMSMNSAANRKRKKYAGRMSSKNEDDGLDKSSPKKKKRRAPAMTMQKSKKASKERLPSGTSLGTSPGHDGRVEVTIPGEHGPRAGSVLAQKGKRFLVLFDFDKSLRWISENSRHSSWKRAIGFDDVRLPTGEVFITLLDEERVRGEAVSLRYCEEALSTLLCLEASDPFTLTPSGQRSKRTEPGDHGIFQQVHRKLAASEYTNAADFVIDMRKALEKIFGENSADSDVGKMGLIMKSVLENSWQSALWDVAEAGGKYTKQIDKSTSSEGDKSSAQEGDTSKAHITELSRFKELVFREEQARSKSNVRSAPSSDSASHRNLHGNLDNRIVGRDIQVFWEGDEAWYRGTVKEYDSETRQHHIQYHDGHEEWIDLHTEPFSFAIEDNKSSTLLLQRLGSIVAAKATSSPWWPAEICLPCVEKLIEFEDVSTQMKKSGLPSEARIMVLYFGEDQYDVLPRNKIKTLDSSLPRKGLKLRGKDDALDMAWDLAAKRATYLGIPPWKEY